MRRLRARCLRGRSAILSMGLFFAAAVIGFPAVNARAEDCSLTRVTEMPLEPGGDGSPVVTILLDGQPRKMLLDTGGFWSLLVPSVTSAYKAGDAPVRGLLGLGGIPLTKTVRVPSIQLGIIKFSRVEFYVGPEEYGRIDGTLGANWLRAFDVEIDPVKNSASLFTQDHCDGQVVYWPHQDLAEIPVKIDNREKRITIPLMLNGKEIEALIDTGSSETVLNLRTAEHLFDLTPQSPGMQLVSSHKDEHGGSRDFYRYQFKTLEMGNIGFGNPWITLAPMSVGGPDLILGMHHLHGLHLYFAYKERKLYATTARGDIAAQNAGGTATPGAAPGHTPDPMDRVNARDRIQEAALALKDNNVTAATAALDTALRLDPGYGPAYLMRARIDLATGERGRAFADMEEAGRREPGDPKIYTERAQIYEAAGDYERAFGDADKAVQLEPKSVSALNNRCWLGAVMGRYDAALADCNAALALDPHMPSTLDSRGFVYLKMSKLDLALADYNAALKQNRRLASSLYGRGLAERQTGEKSDGDDDIAAAEKIDPDIAKHFGK